MLRWLSAQAVTHEVQPAKPDAGDNARTALARFGVVCASRSRNFGSPRFAAVAHRQVPALGAILFLVTVIVAMGLGWWVDRSRLALRNESMVWMQPK